MTQVWEFAAIQAGAQEIHGSVGKTASLLDEGNASLHRLGAIWQGEAHEAYQALQMRWDSTAQELNSALQNLAQTIDDAAHHMIGTELSIKGMF